MYTTNSACDSPRDYRGKRNERRTSETRTVIGWVMKGSRTPSMKAPNTAAGGEDVDFT